MDDSAVIEIKEHLSRTMSSSGSEAAPSLDHHNLTALRHNETVSCRKEYALKVRKPYTITKQREKWTDEDHKRFVEALKLYGRAWRRIEEHVGTKTAVQIRSHAQKFFSKVGRESDANFREPIEIPPPRPKRKPTHPYPRKLVIPLIEDSYLELARTKSSFGKENQSPTSVLSVVGSDTLGSISSSSPRSSPDQQYSSRRDLVPSEELTAGASVRRVKLFGKTVLVTDCHITTSQAVLTCKSLCSVVKSKPIQPVAREFVPGEVSSTNSALSWPIEWYFSSIVQAKETKHHRRKSSTGSNSGSVNYTENVEGNMDVETQSSRCSSNDEEMELTCVSEFRTSERSAFSRLRPNLQKKTLKGFVPYKKRRTPGGEETKSSPISPHKGSLPETSLRL